ncbi:DNA-binding response regulator, OmpR family, contains REC and winged-helix (wHTH) domain [Clostridium collagenovorans DSM 3089]|uniref:Stage 0 sporulation protein A homolog n=2 Tax=Clostridium TaxID=1485 RepID=A0A1M5Y7Z3_9CLOT|nr:DNA-binding response regulator, OmpR family, contains REC and winged-helix (wHTH) domain [Clostridium collagenovorans DSM 3089]
MMEGTIGKVLVVDDDENISEVIKIYLQNLGYDTMLAHDGKDALEKFSSYKPNLIILDVMLPYMDGIDVLKQIRRDSEVPVILLTAKGDTFDKVLGLELGADDYMVKPFEPKELTARVKAVLRRYNADNTNRETLTFEDLVIEIASYNVIYKGKEIKMPPKEFELLHYLASNKNKVFTREQLLCEVWGYDYPGDSRTVDVHIKRLREKLQGTMSWQIETVWGVGYKFEVR